MSALPPEARHGAAFQISTCFGIGLLPKAPGTWASLAALPFAWLIMRFGGWPALAIGIGIVFIAGSWAADRLAKSCGIQDPGFIVIDEIAGQWLVLILAPLNPFYYAAGFVLFRIFDIWKPWPVRWADRAIKGGIGIMADDILAALYGLIVLSVGSYLVGQL